MVARYLQEKEDRIFTKRNETSRVCCVYVGLIYLGGGGDSSRKCPDVCVWGLKMYTS